MPARREFKATNNCKTAFRKPDHSTAHRQGGRCHFRDHLDEHHGQKVESGHFLTKHIDMGVGELEASGRIGFLDVFNELETRLLGQTGNVPEGVMEVLVPEIGQLEEKHQELIEWHEPQSTPIGPLSNSFPPGMVAGPASPASSKKRAPA